MKWKILTAGKPSLNYAAEAAELYLERLRAFTDIQWLPLKITSTQPSSKTADLFLEKSEKTFRVVLDERGELLSTTDLIKKLDTFERRGIHTASLMIGPADGHDSKVIEKVDWLWSLSPMTFQHELALVVALEQLYRIYALRRGHPYHRE